MPRGEKSIKRQVRERAGNRCSECGMTAEEHKRRFGKNLDVHRTTSWGPFSLGPYDVKKAVALCDTCHRAKHSLKCAIRRRDGFVCTECGMTNEEHHKVYDGPMPVHCLRALPERSPGRNCDEDVWRKNKVKPQDCVTLCQFCHHAKHSIKPAVLKRDDFRCTECGRRPENFRLWYAVLCVHRLSGDCEKYCGPDTDPAGFVTLCIECHEKRHPDRLSEAIQFGGQLKLPKVIEQFPEEFGITLPVTSKQQLAAYKQYLLVVNFFLQHFRRRGVPKSRPFRKKLLDMPDTSLSMVLRREAAEEAIGHIAKPFLYFNVKEQKRMVTMAADARAAYVRQKTDDYLDRKVKGNLEPRVTLSTGLCSSRSIKI
jgi:hypothetical protein